MEAKHCQLMPVILMKAKYSQLMLDIWKEAKHWKIMPVICESLTLPAYANSLNGRKSIDSLCQLFEWKPNIDSLCQILMFSLFETTIALPHFTFHAYLFESLLYCSVVYE